MGATAVAAQIQLHDLDGHQLLDVSCDRGSADSEVVLRGTVTSWYLKQLAQEVVRRTDGVQTIVNQVAVLAAGRHGSEAGQRPTTSSSVGARSPERVTTPAEARDSPPSVGRGVRLRTELLFQRVPLLIVDDSPNVRQMLRLAFQNYGVSNILEAVSGQQAIRTVHDQAVGFVLLDLNLGSESGLTVLQQIKAAPAAPPVLIHSYCTDADCLAECYSQGANGYLVKGMGARQIWQTVQQVMSGENAWTSEQLEQIRQSTSLAGSPEKNEKLTETIFRS